VAPLSVQREQKPAPMPIPAEPHPKHQHVPGLEIAPGGELVTTAADVYVGSGIGFGTQFGTIEKRPAFEQYWKRLSARPAALRAKEIDDALAAEQAQRLASGQA